MATLQSIVDKISRLVDPNPSVEILRTVERLVLNYRALLIRRDYEKKKFIHDKWVQTIPGIILYKTNGYGPEHLRSFKSESIPSFVRLQNQYAIQFVGTKDRKQEFTYVNPGAVKILSYSRYSYKSDLFTIIDGCIYIFVQDHSINEEDTDVFYPEKLRVEGVFEDPTKLFDFTDVEGIRAYDLDSEFPITEDLEQQITQSILSTELTVLNPERRNEIRTDPQ